MQIRIEIVPYASGGMEVMVTWVHDDPAVMNYLKAVLEEIAQGRPVVVMRTARPETVTIAVQLPVGKRGGPAGTPEDQKMEIVKGWLEVRGRMNQEVYARSRGVASSTLRRWMQELREASKL